MIAASTSNTPVVRARTMTHLLNPVFAAALGTGLDVTENNFLPV